MRPNQLAGKAFLGVPTYFSACCHDVRCRNIDAGYDHPAHELCRHLQSHCPYELEFPEWQQVIQELLALAKAGNDAAVLGWFLDWFPRCMAKVPKRRRGTFLAGVYRAIANGLLQACAPES